MPIFRGGIKKNDKKGLENKYYATVTTYLL